MKYNGTYACGHEGTITLYGSGKDRDRQYQRIFSQYCPDCRRKEKEEQDIKAAQEAEERGFPDLSGTEKQVAWANTLRLQQIDLMYSVFDSLSPDYSVSINSNSYTKTDLLELTNALIRNATEARFWIDTRDQSLGYLLLAAFDKGVLSSKVPDAVAEEIEAEKAALTAKPESPSKPGLVVIDQDAEKVTAKYIRDEDFIKIAKSLRFKWNGSAWYHPVGEFSGSGDDLAAALGNALLAAGYTVQFASQAQLDMAVAGTYTPECTRWIKYSPEHDDLYILWDGHNDTIYQAALKLPGAKYSDRVVHVKAEYYDQLIDFADVLKFKISEKALDRIQAYRDSRERFSSVSVSVPAVDAQSDEDRIRQSLVKDGTILEDLKDDT